MRRGALAAAGASRAGVACAGADAGAGAAGGAAATAVGAADEAAGAAASVGGGALVADHQPATTPPTRPSATTRNPIDGPQRSLRPGLAMRPPPCARQGAAVLDVDTAQPMRSWPYWFQIGLLPLVKDV